MQLPGRPIRRLESQISRAQWKYFWLEPVFVPSLSLGFHAHCEPPHIHLDLHLPFLVVLIGNHGLKEILAEGGEGHTGASHSCGGGVDA